MRRDFLRLLASTSSEHEVVNVAVRFLAEWKPSELASIPPSCRPGLVRDAEEIADSAFALTRARIESSGSQPLLEEMEAFFAHACARISELEAAPRRLAGKSYLTR